MDILNISVDAARACFVKQNVFYTEQGQWIGDKTKVVIVAYHAKAVGNNAVLSRCDCNVGDLDLLVANKCSSEDDAIAMVLNAIV